MREPFSPPDLSGRIAIVTGANSGIGLWTAIGLARAGAKTVLVCRDAKRGAEARSLIAERAGKAPADLLLADFASLKAVNVLGRKIREAYPRVHMLVNNAGLMSLQRELTGDGYEMTFAVNHLAPFLLTERVLPSLLQAGADGNGPARVVNVASEASANAAFDLDDLMSAQDFKPLRAYGRSKLANILFTKELARHLEGRPVTANCLHPGLVGTSFGNKGGLWGLGWSLLKPFIMSPERGAANSLYVATAPELKNVSGLYFVREKPARVNPIAEDAEIARRLWTESNRLVEAALRGAAAEQS